MPKRASYHMVEEDDPGFQRFWAAYEKRVAKKDARKAWAELNPSPELVDQICLALEWQFTQPEWAKQNYQFAPYPASYLRGSRWEDERRKTNRRPPSETDRRGWECPHLERCGHRSMCEHKDRMPGKYPRRPEADSRHDHT